MSEISTSKQRVNMGAFGPNHDQTFRGKKEKRPGKTVYVERNGRIVEKEPDTVFLMAIDPAGRVNKNFDQFTKNVVMQMAAPSSMIHGSKDRSMSGRMVSTRRRTV